MCVLLGYSQIRLAQPGSSAIIIICWSPIHLYSEYVQNSKDSGSLQTLNFKMKRIINCQYYIKLYACAFGAYVLTINRNFGYRKW